LPEPPRAGPVLYIAKEITKAHGGTLNVTSSTDETRFNLRMPAG
jgi:signal transduction histidine kinase